MHIGTQRPFSAITFLVLCKRHVWFCVVESPPAIQWMSNGAFERFRKVDQDVSRSLLLKLTLPILNLLSFKAQKHQKMWNLLYTVMLVFIGWPSLSTLRWLPICQGFSHLFLHHFELAKLATSSIHHPCQEKLSICHLTLSTSYANLIIKLDQTRTEYVILGHLLSHLLPVWFHWIFCSAERTTRSRSFVCFAFVDTIFKFSQSNIIMLICLFRLW